MPDQDLYPVPADWAAKAHMNREAYGAARIAARETPDAFWAESARVDDAYNVCGLTALATLAEVLPPAAMVLLGHDIMREAPTLSAVSFAAATFTAR